jgi:ABC-2 type transport system permease protein
LSYHQDPTGDERLHALRKSLNAGKLALTTTSVVARIRIHGSGPVSYVLLWMTFPLFNLFLVTLVYHDRTGLRDYSIVASSGVALLFGMLFNAGEILENERQRGTLANLFIAPGPRYAWLAGFQLFAIVESTITAALTLTIATFAFGANLAIDPSSLVVALFLFLVCMWGFSLTMTAIDLSMRSSNQLSNLLVTPLSVLSGTMFPIDDAPRWIRFPAHILPFSYGIQALVDATIHHATISHLGPQLLPLAGFAFLLPILGILSFNRTERRVRQEGSLDLL